MKNLVEKLRYCAKGTQIVLLKCFKKVLLGSIIRKNFEEPEKLSWAHIENSIP